MAAPVIQFKRGSSTSIAAGIVSFRAGEPGFTTDKYDFYIGLSSTSATNQFFGSARYWNRETTTVGSSVRVVEGSTNGSNFIALKSPDSLATDYTYTLPVGVSTAGYVLQTDGTGILSWAPSVSANSVGLGTNTTGQYARTIIGGNGLSATTAAVDDGTDYTIDVNVGSGITITSDAVAFKNAASLVNNFIMKWDSTNGQLVNSTVSDNGTTVSIPVGVITTLSGTNVNYSGIGTIATLSSTSGTITTLSGTNVNYSGIGTIATLSSTSGTITTLTGTNVNYSGIGTIATFNSTSGTITTLSGTNLNYSGIGTIGNLTVTGTLTGTATTATKINTTASTSTGYIPFVANSTTTTGETLLVDAGIQYNGTSDSLIVSNAQHSAVKALDGTAAITIASVTGAVGITSDLTVNGNLFVNGSQTVVNTGELQVYDRTITLGIQSGTTPTTTTWDLGILMNYGDAGTAKTSAVIWESTNKRFQFAANSDNLSGISTTTPQITVATGAFAPIEINALWINDTAGQSAIVSYLAADGLFTGAAADRYLQNITVDAGTF